VRHMHVRSAQHTGKRYIYMIELVIILLIVTM